MNLLEKLTQTFSPSGNEEKIRDIITKETDGLADEVSVDNLGNLILHKKGNGKKVMFATHMDEIGIMVTFIEENGFLRFAPVGGVPVYTSLYQIVEFGNGTKGVVAYEEKINLKTELNISKMYIDIGVKNAKEAQEKVNIGDTAVFCGPFIDMGDSVVSKALDDRAGVYVLINAIKQIQNTDNDLYFVFSTQEELGLRGARAAANTICPDIALAIDVTDTGDTPECNRMAVKLGHGPCIKFMDDSIITHKDVNDALKSCAEEIGIQIQNEVLTFGGTDAGSIHTSGVGVKTGAVSIPTRYIHTPRECVSKNDLSDAAKLVATFAQYKF